MVEEVTVQQTIFVIEHCMRGSLHGQDPRNDKDQFRDYADQVSQKISGHVPGDASTVKNKIPKSYVDYDIYCQLIPNNDEREDFYEMIPRIGAFEVSYQGLLIHSKLGGDGWPNPQQVAEKCAAVAQAVKIGDDPTPFLTSKKDTSRDTSSLEPANARKTQASNDLKRQKSKQPQGKQKDNMMITTNQEAKGRSQSFSFRARSGVKTIRSQQTAMEDYRQNQMQQMYKHNQFKFIWMPNEDEKWQDIEINANKRFKRKFKHKIKDEVIHHQPMFSAFYKHIDKPQEDETPHPGNHWLCECAVCDSKKQFEEKKQDTAPPKLDTSELPIALANQVKNVESQLEQGNLEAAINLIGAIQRFIRKEVVYCLSCPDSIMMMKSGTIGLMLNLQLQRIPVPMFVAPQKYNSATRILDLNVQLGAFLRIDPVFAESQPQHCAGLISLESALSRQRSIQSVNVSIPGKGPLHLMNVDGIEMAFPWLQNYVLTQEEAIMVYRRRLMAAQKTQFLIRPLFAPDSPQDWLIIEQKAEENFARYWKRITLDERKRGKGGKRNSVWPRRGLFNSLGFVQYRQKLKQTLGNFLASVKNQTECGETPQSALIPGLQRNLPKLKTSYLPNDVADLLEKIQDQLQQRHKKEKKNEDQQWQLNDVIDSLRALSIILRDSSRFQRDNPIDLCQEYQYYKKLQDHSAQPKPYLTHDELELILQANLKHRFEKQASGQSEGLIDQKTCPFTILISIAVQQVPLPMYIAPDQYSLASEILSLNFELGAFLKIEPAFADLQPRQSDDLSTFHNFYSLQKKFQIINSRFPHQNPIHMFAAWKDFSDFELSVLRKLLNQQSLQSSALLQKNSRNRPPLVEAIDAGNIVFIEELLSSKAALKLPLEELFPLESIDFWSSLRKQFIPDKDLPRHQVEHSHVTARSQIQSRLILSIAQHIETRAAEGGRSLADSARLFSDSAIKFFEALEDSEDCPTTKKWCEARSSDFKSSANLLRTLIRIKPKIASDCAISALFSHPCLQSGQLIMQMSIQMNEEELLKIVEKVPSLRKIFFSTVCPLQTDLPEVQKKNQVIDHNDYSYHSESKYAQTILLKSAKILRVKIHNEKLTLNHFPSRGTNYCYTLKIAMLREPQNAKLHDYILQNMNLDEFEEPQLKFEILCLLSHFVGCQHPMFLKLFKEHVWLMGQDQPATTDFQTSQAGTLKFNQIRDVYEDVEDSFQRMVLLLGINLIRSHEHELFEEYFLSLRSFYMPQFVMKEFLVQAIRHHSIDCLAVVFALCYLDQVKHTWKLETHILFTENCDNVQLNRDKISSTSALLHCLRKTKVQFYNDRWHFSLLLTNFLKVAPDSAAERCIEHVLKHKMIDEHVKCFAKEHKFFIVPEPEEPEPQPGEGQPQKGWFKNDQQSIVNEDRLSFYCRFRIIRAILDRTPIDKFANFVSYLLKEAGESASARIVLLFSLMEYFQSQWKKSPGYGLWPSRDMTVQIIQTKRRLKKELPYALANSQQLSIVQQSVDNQEIAKMCADWIGIYKEYYQKKCQKALLSLKEYEKLQTQELFKWNTKSYSTSLSMAQQKFTYFAGIVALMKYKTVKDTLQTLMNELDYNQHQLYLLSFVRDEPISKALFFDVLFNIHQNNDAHNIGTKMLPRVGVNIYLTRYWSLKKVFFPNACPIAVNYAFEQIKNSAKDYTVCTYHHCTDIKDPLSQFPSKKINYCYSLKIALRREPQNDKLHDQILQYMNIDGLEEPRLKFEILCLLSHFKGFEHPTVLKLFKEHVWLMDQAQPGTTDFKISQADAVEFDLRQIRDEAKHSQISSTSGYKNINLDFHLVRDVYEDIEDAFHTMVLFLGKNLIQSHKHELFEEFFLSMRSFFMPESVQKEFLVHAIRHYSIDCLPVLFALCYLDSNKHKWNLETPLIFDKDCDQVQLNKDQVSSTGALLIYLKNKKAQFYNNKWHFSLCLTNFLKAAPDQAADRCIEHLLKHQMIDEHARCYGKDNRFALNCEPEDLGPESKSCQQRVNIAAQTNEDRQAFYCKYHILKAVLNRTSIDKFADVVSYMQKEAGESAAVQLFTLAEYFQSKWKEGSWNDQWPTRHSTTHNLQTKRRLEGQLSHALTNRDQLSIVKQSMKSDEMAKTCSDWIGIDEDYYKKMCQQALQSHEENESEQAKRFSKWETRLYGDYTTILEENEYLEILYSRTTIRGRSHLEKPKSTHFAGLVTLMKYNAVKDVMQSLMNELELPQHQLYFFSFVRYKPISATSFFDVLYQLHQNNQVEIKPPAPYTVSKNVNWFLPLTEQLTCKNLTTLVAAFRSLELDIQQALHKQIKVLIVENRETNERLLLSSQLEKQVQKLKTREKNPHKVLALLIQLKKLRSNPSVECGSLKKFYVSSMNKFYHNFCGTFTQNDDFFSYFLELDKSIFEKKIQDQVGEESTDTLSRQELISYGLKDRAISENYLYLNQSEELQLKPGYRYFIEPVTEFILKQAQSQLANLTESDQEVPLLEFLIHTGESQTICKLFDCGILNNIANVLKVSDILKLMRRQNLNTKAKAGILVGFIQSLKKILEKDQDDFLEKVLKILSFIIKKRIFAKDEKPKGPPIQLCSKNFKSEPSKKEQLLDASEKILEFLIQFYGGSQDDIETQCLQNLACIEVVDLTEMQEELSQEPTQEFWWWISHIDFERGKKEKTFKDMLEWVPSYCSVYTDEAPKLKRHINITEGRWDAYKEILEVEFEKRKQSLNLDFEKIEVHSGKEDSSLAAAIEAVEEIHQLQVTQTQTNQQEEEKRLTDQQAENDKELEKLKNEITKEQKDNKESLENLRSQNSKEMEEKNAMFVELQAAANSQEKDILGKNQAEVKSMKQHHEVEWTEACERLKQIRAAKDKIMKEHQEKQIELERLKQKLEVAKNSLNARRQAYFFAAPSDDEISMFITSVYLEPKRSDVGQDWEVQMPPSCEKKAEGIFAKAKIVSVGQNIFTFSGGEKVSVWQLQNLQGYMQQRTEESLPFSQPLTLFSVALYNAASYPTIYLTGGLSGDATQDHLFAFDKQSDETWQWRKGDLPRLNQKRHSHSCTTVGKNLVVAGGSSDGNCISSIELLDLGVPSDQSSQWVTLEGVGAEKLTPRVFPVVAPLSETKFAIFGGISNEKDLSDVYTVEIQTKEVVQKIADCGFGFHCKSYGTMVKEGHIMALVADQQGALAIVHYNEEVNSFTQKCTLEETL